MKDRYLKAMPLGIALAATLCAVTAFGHDDKKTNSVRGVFIGDSNTAADTRVGQGLGFVGWLNVMLGYKYVFFNGGCYGATTRDWWLPKRIHAPYSFCYSNSGGSPRLFNVRAAPFLPADFAVIMLGSNDSVGALEDGPTTVAEYGKSLEQMSLAVARRGTPLVILMTPATRLDCIEQAIQQNPWGVDCLARLRGYREEVLRICREHEDEGIVCGPDVQAMTIADVHAYFNPQAWNNFDKTHFTSAGHSLIAFALQATLAAHGL
jgi:lysophospholipase L1-like esterase